MTTTRLRPVKSVADYGAALSRIEVLMEIEGRSDVETDELEVLAALVEMYEDAEFPMPVPSPIAAIKFRMKQLEMGQSDPE